MPKFRRTINFDENEFQRAEQLAVECGSTLNGYIRHALQRHNDGVSVMSILENSSAHLEVLMEQLREENATLRRSLLEDHQRLRAELKAEQDQAIERYEDALRRVLTSAISTPVPQRSSPAARGAGLPVSKPNV